MIPAAKQHKAANNIVKFGFVPLSIRTFDNFAKTHPEKPIIEGKERSISPDMITRVIASAMIPENGIVDMKE
jgi:hypothetical protein